MQAYDIIAAKRDGRELSADEIRAFIQGVTAGIEFLLGGRGRRNGGGGEARRPVPQDEMFI